MEKFKEVSECILYELSDEEVRKAIKLLIEDKYDFCGDIAEIVDDEDGIWSVRTQWESVAEKVKS